MAKNIGGAAKRVQITLHELGEKLQRAYSMGVEAGREAEQKLARLATQNDCPMCAQKAELDDVKRELAIRGHPHRKGHVG